MLKKETLDKLKALKLDPDKLIEAIKADTEVDFAIPDVVALTQDELTTRDNNMKATGKTEAKTEVETEVNNLWKKELGKKLNTEIKGDRIGDVAKEIEKLINADGNEKLTTLQEQNRLLIEDKAKWEQEKARLESEKNQVAADFDIISDFPKRLDLLNDKEYLAAIKGQLEFKEDGIYKGGQLLRNPTTQAPLSRKEALETVFAERKWIAQEGTGVDRGGRGTGNSTATGATGIKTKSQAIEAWKALDPANNTNPVSDGFLTYMEGIASKDPQFNMHG